MFSKNSNKTQVSLPQFLIDPISLEPLDENSIFVMPYGDAFNGETLEKHWSIQKQNAKQLTCPLRQYSFSEHKIPDPLQNEIKSILQATIKEIKSAEKNKDKLIQLPNFIIKKEDELKSKQAELQEIVNLKKRTRLEINVENLSFWNEDSSVIKSILKLVGSDKLLKMAGYMVFNSNNKKTILSNTIFNLMETANQPSKSRKELEDKLNKTTHQLKRRCFSCCLFSRAEKQLLNSEIGDFAPVLLKNKR